MRRLSIIPYALATIVLAVLVAILVTSLYIFAYVVPVAGLLLAAVGVVALEPLIFISGMLFAGFGGFVYVEWFADDPGGLPTVTELAERVVRCIDTGTDHPDEYPLERPEEGEDDG